MFEYNFSNLFSSFGLDDIHYKKDGDGNTIVEIEVPGFNKDNLTIEIENGVITIQGETETRKVYKKYTLGEVKDVKATIKDGILSLILLKPDKETTRIEITS